MTVIDLANPLRAALEAAGFNGLLDVRFEGSRSTSWVGPPATDDGDQPVAFVQIKPSAHDHLA